MKTSVLLSLCVLGFVTSGCNRIEIPSFTSVEIYGHPRDMVLDEPRIFPEFERYLRGLDEKWDESPELDFAALCIELKRGEGTIAHLYIGVGKGNEWIGFEPANNRGPLPDGRLYVRKVSEAEIRHLLVFLMEPPSAKRTVEAIARR